MYATSTASYITFKYSGRLYQVRPLPLNSSSFVWVSTHGSFTSNSQGLFDLIVVTYNVLLFLCLASFYSSRLDRVDPLQRTTSDSQKSWGALVRFCRSFSLALVFANLVSFLYEIIATHPYALVLNLIPVPLWPASCSIPSTPLDRPSRRSWHALVYWLPSTVLSLHSPTSLSSP